MAKSLVIVESPAKARTLNKFLGKDFTVMASVGHIKDLPKSKLGVDIEKDFEPHYVTIKGKGKTIAELKKAGSKAENIYLAPDPDREGEAIAWHIADEVAGKKKKARVYRVLFNEITEQAVKEAIAHPRELDRNKFEAQQARRILDRLVGYQVSPILWEKVRRGLSAGRVQSVAVRLVCERERAIQAFEPREYWSVTALLKAGGDGGFEARLAKKGGAKIEIGSEAEASAVVAELSNAEFVVAEAEKKERKRNPLAPFTTSKLQQEAARKLGFTAKKTMVIAQQLYEGVDIGEAGPVGLISYMRTDSTRVSAEAVTAVRTLIKERYGDAYLPKKPNVYRNKKSAQDAHEAIRPTYFQYPPEAVKPHLSRDQFRLYQLIWNRFVASQMAPALFDQTRVKITAGEYVFQATGTVMKFPGFTAVYVESRDEEEEKAAALPPLSKGDKLELKSLVPQQHFTQPPPRYTEATLVKELEENGIGRPSTYAAILSTIQEREYVVKEGSQLKPTDLGFLVTDMLVESFPEILDVEFTAHMEEELDLIEEGKVPWLGVMREFYGPFKASLERARTTMRNVKAEEEPTDIECDKCGRKMVIKWGRKGRFLACPAYPECKNTKDFTIDDDGRVVVVEREEEVRGQCPQCGKPMVLKSGRFGRFLACSDYPRCKTTRPYSTGIKCGAEGCDGELVERRTRKGRIFYSCSRYPQCEYATWKLPDKENSR